MFVGQGAVDAFILAGAAIFTLVTIAYVAMLWSVRRNFFILLRSPLLTCMFGFFVVVRYDAKAYEYVVTWHCEDIGQYGVAALVGGASLLAADVAVVMIVVRLLVMYYPSKRARWGRYAKEKVLIGVLGGAWVLTEVSLWSAAWSLGISRIASTVETVLRPLSFFVTFLASTWLVCQLRNVHDSTNLSRDIGTLGRVLVVTLSLFAALQVFPLPSVASKYAQIALLSVAKMPPVYLIIIRPVREVLRHVPGRRRTVFQKLLAPAVESTPDCCATDDELPATWQGRTVCVDGNRLATIMSFPALTKAFGEFCRKSLCSESFEFLVDVAKFKAFDRGAGGDNGDGEVGVLAYDFAAFRTIVHDYIRHDAHSEINIGSTTKQSILSHVTFEAYRSLSPNDRREVFNGAEVSTSNLLANNLLHKFLGSPQYAEVVDLEDASIAS